METTLNKENTSLAQAWETLKIEQPNLRIRNAAQILGVSEAALLATQLGESVLLLEGDFTQMFMGMKEFGKVMSLTRNNGCVLEHKGTFQKISIHGEAPNQIATVIGPIEQRVFFSSWKYAFAVIQDAPKGTMRSIQFFDKAGEAILKVYLQESSNVEAFESFVEEYKSPDQTMAPVQAFDRPVYADKVDQGAFQQDWENMKDTHDFFGMLKKHNIHRLEALKTVDNKWAYEVDKYSVRKILEVAAANKIPIMIFAGNKGNIQIHQGKVRTIRQMGDWLNVLDPDFNMHLDESTIVVAWVVHKNTTDGLVSAIELFDKDGEMIAQFFGLRKPGLPQNPQWKELVDTL
jgi:putative hemin transport protein